MTSDISLLYPPATATEANQIARQIASRIVRPCAKRGEMIQESKECGACSVYACPIFGECVAGVPRQERAGCGTCSEYERAPVDLATYFDRVVVVNLKRRPDRLESFRQEIAKGPWPFREPEVFEAIDGSKVPTPLGWTQGGGTWGCLQSHRQILERAIQDGVQSLLVLEDDLCCRPGYVQDLLGFFGDLPGDWDQVMLGGQHIAPPIRTNSDVVVRCVNAQRTHAYGIRGQFLRDLYARWTSHLTTTHCDHVMGPLQPAYKVYAPAPFIFGQTQSQSDISGAANPTKFWTPPTGNEPVYLIRGERDVVEQLRDRGVHIGFARDQSTGVDLGLIEAFESAEPMPKLARWVSDLQWEVASMDGCVLGVWHPKVTEDMLRSCWSGPVVSVDATTIQSALEAIGDRPMRTRATRAVVLLRAPRGVAEQMRGLGWHTGNWRDHATGLDHGLIQWAENPSVEKLGEVARTLVAEARDLRDGIACIWHPKVSAEQLAEATAMRVIEIDAASTEDAVRKLEEALRSDRGDLQS